MGKVSKCLLIPDGRGGLSHSFADQQVEALSDNSRIVGKSARSGKCKPTPFLADEGLHNGPSSLRSAQFVKWGVSPKMAYFFTKEPL